MGYVETVQWMLPNEVAGGLLSGSGGGDRRACRMRRFRSHQRISDAAGTGREVAPGVTPPTQLPAPSLVSPATDARFTRGQPIAFDWSDVAGAAGYTIQIDDSSTFSAPLTLRRNLTPSAFTTSTLPATTLWWRVRAKDSAGAAGKWSVTRRFAITN